MAESNGKTVVCVDCPLDSGDQQISQFMYNRRSEANGLYDKIAGMGFNVVRLLQPTLSDLQEAVSDPSVAFLSASGHGTSDGVGFVRNLQEDLLHAGSGFFDRNAFNNKIIHLFACDTAKILGPYLVTKDLFTNTQARAFFGYNADFAFAADYGQDPVTAQMFIDCDSAIDLALASGSPLQNALTAGATAFVNLVEQWKADQSRAALAVLLQKDMNALCLLPAGVTGS
jgi:hypothetical protein